VIALRATDTAAMLTVLRDPPSEPPRFNAMFVWWPMAWFVAMSKVGSAVARNEVFDLPTSLAFVVAVVMPVLQLGQLARTARSAALAFKKAWRARRADRNRPDSDA
jgi:hypothetical protein